MIDDDMGKELGRFSKRGFDRNNRRRILSKDKTGVAEVYSNLLTLTITLILFTSIFAVVSQLDTPDDQYHVRLHTEYEYNVGVDYINITHTGGKNLNMNDILFTILIEDQEGLYSFRFNKDEVSKDGDENLWTIGETVYIEHDLGGHIHGDSVVELMIWDNERSRVIHRTILVEKGREGLDIRDAWIDYQNPWIDYSEPLERITVNARVVVLGYLRLEGFSYENLTVEARTVATGGRRVIHDMDAGENIEEFDLHHVGYGTFRSRNLRVAEGVEYDRYIIKLTAVYEKDDLNLITEHYMYLNVGEPEARRFRPDLVIGNVEYIPRSPSHNQDFVISVEVFNRDQVDYTTDWNVRDNGDEVFDKTSTFYSGPAPTLVRAEYKIMGVGLHEIEINIGTTLIDPEGRIVPDVDPENNRMSLSLIVDPKVLLVRDMTALENRDLGLMKNALTGLNFDYHEITSGVFPENLNNYSICVWLTGDGDGEMLLEQGGSQDNLVDYTENYNGNFWLMGSNLEGRNFQENFRNVLGLDLVMGYIELDEEVVSEHEEGTYGGFEYPVYPGSQANLLSALISVEDENKLWHDNIQLVGFGHEAGENGARTAINSFLLQSVSHPSKRADMVHEVIMWLSNLTTRTGTDVAVSSHLIEPVTPMFMDEVVITATVRNNGPEDLYDVSVGILKNNRLMRAEDLVEIGANPMRIDELSGLGGTAEVEFRWQADVLGIQEFVVIADYYDELDDVNRRNNDIRYKDLDITEDAIEVEVQYSTLVVDADMSDYQDHEDVTGYVIESLERLGQIEGENYVHHLVEGEGGPEDGPSADMLQNYNAVIWVTGERDEVVFTGADVDSLRSYFNSGRGNVMFIGEHILTYLDTSGLVGAGELMEFMGVSPIESINSGSSATIIGHPNCILGRNLRYNLDTDFMDANTFTDTSEYGEVLFRGEGLNFGSTYDDGSRKNIFMGINPNRIQEPLLLAESFEDWPRGTVDLSQNSAIDELFYTSLWYLGLIDHRTELRIVDYDILVSHNRPETGGSYEVTVEIMNYGYKAASTMVRLKENDDHIRTRTILVEGSKSESSSGSTYFDVQPGRATAEFTWEPHFAGMRALRVKVDPLGQIDEIEPYGGEGTEEKIMEFNNQGALTVPVYYFFDDMESGTGRWRHDTNLMNVDGSSALDFINRRDLDTNVIGDWDWTRSGSSYEGSREFGRGAGVYETDDPEVAHITGNDYHSPPRSFWLPESGSGEAEVGEWVIMAFTDTGNHQWNVPEGVTEVDVLVVGGGGGGGSSAGGGASGGGGGAGGLIFETEYDVSGTPSIDITVGDGGSGAPAGDNDGGDGGNSIFNTLEAIGGGGGGGRNRDGRVGGSGGGGGGRRGGGGGSGTPNQGNNGGDGAVAAAGDNPGGGGGGAGESGAPGVLQSHGGDGGDGLDYSHVFGTSYGDSGWFAGGGGGGASTGGNADTTGSGGQGGGGDGGLHANDGDSAAANTGGGGGGAGRSGQTGGNGGSGIVIITYFQPGGLFETGTEEYQSEPDPGLRQMEFIVAFTDTGSHTWNVPAGVTEVDVLVVGGGGGGGGFSNAASNGAGGGGAGGVIFEEGYVLSDTEIDDGVSYTVGAGGDGGVGASSAAGKVGGNSVFGTLAAIGGGGGGGYDTATRAATIGGSGGGAHAMGTAQTGASGTAGQGNAGGNTGVEASRPGAGGGGFSQAGGSNAGNLAGAGGDGLYFGDIFGVDYGEDGWFAGGGGGGRNGGTGGAGGTGGGGNGNSAGNGQSATANTGGGGGGAGGAGNVNGGDGGSGIVIIRYVVTEARYMRNDDVLGTTQTDSHETWGDQFHQNDDPYWGIRVWVGNDEVTEGEPVAVVSREDPGSGMQEATWTPPRTSLDPGDTITVIVYFGNSDTPDTTVNEFETEPLEVGYLESTEWTVFYSTERAAGAGHIDAYFSYGDFDHNSRIEGITLSPPGPLPPTEPNPIHGATDTPLNLELSVYVEHEEGKPMDVRFYRDDGTLIGTDNGVPSGERASVMWIGLEIETTYRWYAVAEDEDESTARSQNWRFTTGIPDPIEFKDYRFFTTEPFRIGTAVLSFHCYHWEGTGDDNYLGNVRIDYEHRYWWLTPGPHNPHNVEPREGTMIEMFDGDDTVADGQLNINPVAIIFNPHAGEGLWTPTIRQAGDGGRVRTLHMQPIDGAVEDFVIIWEDLHNFRTPPDPDGDGDHWVRITLLEDGRFRIHVYRAEGGFRHDFYIGAEHIYTKPRNTEWSTPGNYWYEVDRDELPAFQAGAQARSFYFEHKYWMEQDVNGGMLYLWGSNDEAVWSWNQDTRLYVKPRAHYPGTLKTADLQAHADVGGPAITDVENGLRDAAGRLPESVFTGKSADGTFGWVSEEIDLQRQLEENQIHFNYRYIRVVFVMAVFEDPVDEEWRSERGWYIDKLQFTLTASWYNDFIHWTHTTAQDLVEMGLVTDNLPRYYDHTLGDETGHFWMFGDIDEDGRDYLPPGVDSSIYTDPIYLYNSVNPTLTAHFKFNIHNSAGLPPDGFRVEISTDDGKTWDSLTQGARAAWNYSGYGCMYSGGTGEYGWVDSHSLARLDVNLAGWNGERVILRFRVFTNRTRSPANGDLPGAFFMDDVWVTEGTTDMMSMSPNNAIMGDPERDISKEDTVWKSTETEDIPYDCSPNSSAYSSEDISEENTDTIEARTGVGSILADDKLEIRFFREGVSMGLHRKGGDRVNFCSHMPAKAPEAK